MKPDLREISLALNRDGRWLCSSSFDTAKVWDLETGQEVVSLRGHSGLITSLALSPDGERLDASGDDGAIKIWRLRDRLP